ncbi:helix-turn-helix transcriptional regulator [Aliidiomarina halalkaliphila]|uniref:Helix-turn-helix transcriptional regulator n=1 Tax=Aliidiomarina halalkaliphila TaxID=2593535 RepID=A0A552X4P5_9GAMM|nr:helix-turn-helix transcriptional regulator [Aliidiomarina halalkaliphila]TRW49899.1 helix-turn-helix transcriptional regulator [Aliidiomarina halalkaliphila]
MAKPLPITNCVKELREAMGMTQAELGERVGLTRQTIAAIEQRRYSPSLETAFRIADTFNTNLEAVFEYQP